MIAEFDRLRAREVRDDQGVAVLARSHRYLWPVQACASAKAFHISCGGQAERLAAYTAAPLRPPGRASACFALPSLSAAALAQHASELTADPVWRDFFASAFEQLGSEYGDCLAPGNGGRLALRLRPRDSAAAAPGLFLGTVHPARGLSSATSRCWMETGRRRPSRWKRPAGSTLRA